MVRPYEHVKHMPNFKPHGRHVRPCGRIFKFYKFWRKKKEIESFDVNSENSSPKGFFWPSKKKSLFRFCRPILDIFGLTLLRQFVTSSFNLKHRLLLCMILRKIPTLFPWWSACDSSLRWSADMLKNSKWWSRVIIHARVKMMNIQMF